MFLPLICQCAREKQQQKKTTPTMGVILLVKYTTIEYHYLYDS